MASPLFPVPAKIAKMRTNVFLERRVKSEIGKVARMRYGFSASELINGLMKRELKLKGGLLNAKLSTR